MRRLTRSGRAPPCAAALAADRPGCALSCPRVVVFGGTAADVTGLPSTAPAVRRARCRESAAFGQSPPGSRWPESWCDHLRVGLCGFRTKSFPAQDGRNRGAPLLPRILRLWDKCPSRADAAGAVAGIPRVGACDAGTKAPFDARWRVRNAGAKLGIRNYDLKLRRCRVARAVPLRALPAGGPFRRRGFIGGPIRFCLRGRFPRTGCRAGIRGPTRRRWWNGRNSARTGVAEASARCGLGRVRGREVAPTWAHPSGRSILASVAQTTIPEREVRAEQRTAVLDGRVGRRPSPRDRRSVWGIVGLG